MVQTDNDRLDRRWSAYRGADIRTFSTWVTAVVSGVRTPLAWLFGTFAAVLLLAVLFVTIVGWNWLRGPIERVTAQKSGRVLAIDGDLKVAFGWPLARLRADAVTFSNPDWATQRQMVAADAVEVAIDLPQLLRQHIVFPELHLTRPLVFLEQGSGGRKNWLLDREQTDEGARIRIDRLTLDQGTLGYDDAAMKTSIRAQLSTSAKSTEGAAVAFTASGRYKDLPLVARGSGGPVLGLRDESTPYPLKADLTVGRTGAKVDGTITSLLRFSAMDVRLTLHGDSLAQLYPMLGIALPETRPYTTDGHLVHQGQLWRYEHFSGKIGSSDVAGEFQIRTGGVRPALKAELVSHVLDIADLGPLIGAKPGSVEKAKRAASSATATAGTVTTAAAAAPTPAQARLLPDVPFKTDRWNSVDADVTLKASAIRRAKELPLENLVAHLTLQDSVLTLDPVDFGVAGGHLNAVVSLDGRSDPMPVRAKVRARKILIAKLFPTIAVSTTGVGQVNGEFDLTGKGNSVRRMLAGANGKAALVVTGGKVSKLMMEQVGLHLWEILALKISGDKLINLRCGIADFDVRHGTMVTDALIVDTEVTTVFGTGSIDLGEEKLDLTFNQKTKNTSPVALTSPIYIRGSFARPEVGVDKGRVAVRALGAIALGLVNPFLALVPLIDAGPGKDSDCAQLIQDARNLPQPQHKKADLRQ